LPSSVPKPVAAVKRCASPPTCHQRPDKDEKRRNE
jgi:hypothetical protein